MQQRQADLLVLGQLVLQDSQGYTERPCLEKPNFERLGCVQSNVQIPSRASTLSSLHPSTPDACTHGMTQLLVLEVLGVLEIYSS